MVRFGVDLGGTKIEVIALGHEGEECYRQRVATPPGDYAATLQAICGLVAAARDALSLSAQQHTVGIATPGAISMKTGRLKNSNSVCLNDRDIVSDLEACLGQAVRISNDANCFALSEASDGNAVNAHVVFAAIIGTGTGAGIVVNAHVLNGANAIAGEWGHNPLPWPQPDELPGTPCYCGNKGCIETFLSGPGMSQLHFADTGNKLAAEDIVQRSALDSGCENSLQRYEDRLARSLAHVINILDPDVIVLGGGMSNIDRLYANVPRLWRQYVFSDDVNTRLVPPKHGDSSGVRGAAWLWN